MVAPVRCRQWQGASTEYARLWLAPGSRYRYENADTYCYLFVVKAAIFEGTIINFTKRYIHFSKNCKVI